MSAGGLPPIPHGYQVIEPLKADAVVSRAVGQLIQEFVTWFRKQTGVRPKYFLRNDDWHVVFFFTANGEKMEVDAGRGCENIEHAKNMVRLLLG